MAPVTVDPTGRECEIANYLCSFDADRGAGGHGRDTCRELFRQICRSHAALLCMVPEWNGEAADDAPDDMPRGQVVFGVLLAVKLAEAVADDTAGGREARRAAVVRDKDVLALCDGLDIATGGAPLRMTTRWAGGASVTATYPAGALALVLSGHPAE